MSVPAGLLLLGGLLLTVATAEEPRPRTDAMEIPQLFAPFLDGFLDPADQVHAWVMREARRHFAADERRKAALAGPEALRTEQERIRAAFLRSIGGLPAERCPLATRERPRLERVGYTITPLAYQSLPGVWVSADLYRPADLAAPTAAVLMCCGHSAVGKAAAKYQRVCQDLVRAGLVVLIIDAPGLGEMAQCLDADGRAIAGLTVGEHSHLQGPYWLLGRNIARFFAWNAMRGIDLLASLPEVDPGRIGVTGNSGGGHQTQFLMVLDPRVAAAMPCCSLSSRESYLATGVRVYDGEQIQAAGIPLGLDYDDFLSSFAPRPLRIGAAASDFFAIEGVLQSHARARHAYRQAGAEAALDLLVAEDEQHGFSEPLRRGCVDWFSRHLMRRDPPAPPPELALESESDLAAAGGSVLRGIPGARSLWDLVADEWRTARGAAAGSPRDAAWLRERLAIPRAAESIRARWTTRTTGAGWTAERFFFPSEPEVALSGVLYLPAAGARRATVLLIPDGSAGQAQDRPLIDGLLARGQAVLVPDLRGLGGVAMRSRTNAKGLLPRGTEFRVASDHFMLGTSLLAQRSRDLLRHLERLRAHPALGGIQGIGLAARGGPAIYGICAAALDDNLDRALFSACLGTWDSAFDPGLPDHDLFAPSFLAPELGGRADIPDLLRLAARGGVRPLALADLRLASGRPDEGGVRFSAAAAGIPAAERSRLLEASLEAALAFLDAAAP